VCFALMFFTLMRLNPTMKETMFFLIIPLFSVLHHQIWTSLVMKFMCTMQNKVNLKFVWCYKITRCFAIWMFYIVSFVVLWKWLLMMGAPCISVFYMNSIECNYEGKYIFFIFKNRSKITSSSMQPHCKWFWHAPCNRSICAILHNHKAQDVCKIINVLCLWTMHVPSRLTMCNLMVNLVCHITN
jgi:hypothetical protein